MAHESSDPDDGDADPEGETTDDPALAAILRGAARVAPATPPRALLPGSRLGRYVIEGPLGSGGMGSVFRAHDETLRRRVAIKLIAGQGDGMASRLLREARAAAALDHQNIVAIFDVAEHEGTPFIAMELIEGRTLRAALASGEARVDERLRWLVDVARALGAAHDVGLVHRDVKPDNVMVKTGGHVKVLDFGIARQSSEGADPSAPTAAEGLGTITEQGGVVGTPLYMAPEQVRGETVDARADQFAWGVLAYEVLVGTPPWTAKGAMSLGAAITNDDPPPMHLPAGCPPGVEPVIRRALEKKPSARFASMGDVMAAMDAAMGARPSLADQAPPVSGAGQGPRRRWLVGAMVAAGAAGAFALARATGWVGSSPTPVDPLASPASSAASQPAPSSSVTRLIDRPAPASTSPEARAAYTRGLAKLRDGAWSEATESFLRAVALDPEMAAAHFELAICGTFDSDPVLARKHFAEAYDRREHLTPRDREMLDALEPIAMRVATNRREAAGRLRELVSRYPDDAEALVLLSLAALDPVLRLEHAGRAASIDPAYADAWQSKGQALTMLGRHDEAAEALRAGAAISLQSTDCLSWLWGVHALRGDCEGVEEAARTAIDRGEMRAHTALAAAKLGRGAPEAELREIISHAGAPTVSRDRAVAELRLDLALGHFESARKRATADLEAAQGSLEILKHYEPTRQLVMLALEMGDRDEAGRLATDFALRHQAWSAPNTLGGLLAPEVPFLLQVARRDGTLGADDHERYLDRWIASARDRAGVPPPLVWAYAHAAAALSGAQAEAAYRAREDFPGAEIASDGAGDLTSAAHGHVALLAKRPEAKAYLEEAASSCAFYFSPFRHTWATLELGQLLDASGDERGACAAYRKVVDRWGKAKRSVSADQARDRMTALRCP